MWILTLVAAAHVSRRAAVDMAAISLTCSGSSKTSFAAAPIARENAPTFGTAESRTGLLDGIRSSLIPNNDLTAEYALNPTDVSGVALPSMFSTTCNAAIIFHGSGGPDRETDAVQARFRMQDASAGLSREVLVFDWMEWFTPNTNRLSFVSSSVGKRVGESLAKNENLNSLTIVGTSAGSFAADACCSAYVAGAKQGGGSQRAAVHLILADPFAAKDGASFQVGRGAQFFGKDADFAEHILNTDDIVPNTEVPLPLCYCYDVTGAAERRSFPSPEKTGDLVYDLILKSLGYHSWPMGYLARHYTTQLDQKGRLILPNHAEKPRGAVVKVA